MVTLLISRWPNVAMPCRKSTTTSSSQPVVSWTDRQCPCELPAVCPATAALDPYQDSALRQRFSIPFRFLLHQSENRLDYQTDLAWPVPVRASRVHWPITDVPPMLDRFRFSECLNLSSGVEWGKCVEHCWWLNTHSSKEMTKSPSCISSVAVTQFFHCCVSAGLRQGALIWTKNHYS